MAKKRKVCPICGGPMLGYPAISRKDNKTEICNNGGLLEALDVLNTYNKNRG